MTKSIPFFLEFFQEEDLENLANVVKKHSNLSTDWGYMLGDREKCIEKYEEEIIKTTRSKYAIATHADHCALLLAFRALGLKRNHRVICSIYCHPMVPECIRLFDAEPLFVDIDPETLAMLPEQCEELLENGARDRIKAIVVSHVGGLTNMEPFHKMKEKYHVNIIEDLSYSLGLMNAGGVHAGIDLQTDFAIVSRFSGFLRRLSICSALLTNNGDLAKKCRRLRYHSMVRDSVNNSIFYDITDLTLEYNPSIFDLNVATLAVRRNQEAIKRRAQIAKRYREALQDIKGVKFLKQDLETVHAICFIFFERGRDQIANYLSERGIGVRLPYVPFNLLSFHQNKSFLKVTQYPNALDVYQRVLALPCYLGMTDEDVDYVVATLQAILKDENF